MSYPTNTIPIFVPAFGVGYDWSDGQTVYTCTLTWTTFTSGQIYALYTSPDVTNKTFSPNTGAVTYAFAGSSNPYYYFYSFQRICFFFNAMIARAFTALSTASGGTLPVGSEAPQLYYDQNLQKIALRAQKDPYGQETVNPINVYFNNQMLAILNGFDCTLLANNSPTGQDIQMVVRDEVNNTDPSDDTYYLMIPGGWDPSYMSPVASIQVNTSLPIVYEFVQTPSADYFMPATSTVNSSTFNPSQNLLTDFHLSYMPANTINSIFVYNKTDNYRYASISGAGPISAFSLSLTWSDPTGTVIPVYLNIGCSVTMKLAFINKSIINSQGERIKKLDAIIANATSLGQFRDSR